MPRAAEKISALGMGTMRLPLTADEKIDASAAAAMLHYALDSGINYIDTAWPYHDGESEPFVGRTLKDRRKEFMLATKLPLWLVKSREEMDTYLDRQLERLQTDYIDFYLIHALQRKTWDRGVQVGLLDFVSKLRSDSRVRYVGFSFHDGLELFKTIIDAWNWDFCQIQYNYLDTAFQAGTEGLRYASERGVGVVVMEPMRGGLLAKPYPTDIDAWRRAQGISLSPAELAMKWAFNHPEVSVVLTGASSMEQIRENVAIANTSLPGLLTDAEQTLVQKMREHYESLKGVPCTNCHYCMPCPHGVRIPSCFDNYNGGVMNENMDAAKQVYLAYMGEKEMANRCVQCGVCVPKCPQGIDIPTELKKVAEAFGK